MSFRHPLAKIEDLSSYIEIFVSSAVHLKYLIRAIEEKWGPRWCFAWSSLPSLDHRLDSPRIHCHLNVEPRGVQPRKLRVTRRSSCLIPWTVCSTSSAKSPVLAQWHARKIWSSTRWDLFIRNRPEANWHKFHCAAENIYTDTTEILFRSFAGMQETFETCLHVKTKFFGASRMSLRKLRDEIKLQLRRVMPRF